MRLLVLDAETRDPYLKRNGQGWVLGIHYPEYDFNVILFAYMTNDGKVGTTSDWDELQGLLDAHDAIIGHNLMYDIGCLLFVASRGCIKFNLEDKILFDTMIMAKLYNQNFNSYGLDYLGGVLVSQKKESSILHDFAWSTGLYKGPRKRVRPSEAVLEKWCKSNMDLFPREILDQYAVGDIKVTRKLYDRLLDKVSYLDLNEFSDDLKITIDMKLRGVDIDLEQCHAVQKQFEGMAREAEIKIYEELGEVVEIGKIQKQLAPALVNKGYDIPLTDKGNYSITDDWLEEQIGDVFENIRAYRKALQKNRNFIGKLIEYQTIIPEKYRDAKRGKLYPSLKLLGATVTGRFSSGGGPGSLEVSVHQIPTRDPVFSAPCRSVFIPYKGDTWVVGDFNSQESRLQVHDACLLGCAGADIVRDKWIANPLMSYHTEIATMIGIERDHAKTINLGLSYGMGNAKLIAALGVSRLQGEAILTQYHDMLGFMKQLQKKCSDALGINRYIKTLGGRKLCIGKRSAENRNPEKDGLSRRVQGSAADQCRAAMRKAYKEGLKITIVVHDEINISTSNSNTDRNRLKYCMETSLPLSVPVVADIGEGATWLEAKQ